jgi:hypothetical protein
MFNDPLLASQLNLKKLFIVAMTKVNDSRGTIAKFKTRTTEIDTNKIKAGCVIIYYCSKFRLLAQECWALCYLLHQAIQ